MTEKRVALIIATDQYEDKSLRQLISPAHDAEALAGVLKEPDIGGFEVKTLLNETSHRIRREIEAFFIDRMRDDLLLLYFSCHGIKDEDGRLYYSTTDTDRKRLRSPAIESGLVNDIMQRSRSRKQVLLLDCCYSGAFARGMITKADKKVITRNDFEGEGRGRVVLTASDAMQYSFEGDQVGGKGIPSVFTGNLVQGLKTGEADRDADGHITIDELYDYVHDRVVDATPEQRPAKWNFGVQGRIVIARNPNPVIKPVELPAELMQSIQDLRHWVREGAVRELERILNGAHKGLALSAQEALKGMLNDDSERVRKEVARVIETYTKIQPGKITKQEKPPVGESDITPTPVVASDMQAHKGNAAKRMGAEEQERILAAPKIKLRSQPVKNLTDDAVEIMLKDKGFFDVHLNKSAPGFPNNYELQKDGRVVYDYASGLIWQQSGSTKKMPYRNAKAYVEALNSQNFAGYRDWRLPTLEEAMSLMEPKKMNGNLYIDPKFDKQQPDIWSSDTYSASSAWVVNFVIGCGGLGVGSHNLYVRAVR